MSISDDQKLDYLWKKLGYGVSKTDTRLNKGASNESIPSPLLRSRVNLKSLLNTSRDLTSLERTRTNVRGNAY